MRKKNFLNKVLQNTSCPQGFWGRMILRGMNCFHASLANRGMKQVEWQPNWNVLDIGCGGGANLKRLLNLCPKGNIYGIDLSEESVSFAQKYNEKDLNKDVSYNKGMFVHYLMRMDSLMLSRLLKRSILVACKHSVV